MRCPMVLCQARRGAALIAIGAIIGCGAWSVFAMYATTIDRNRSPQTQYIDQMHQWLEPVPKIMSGDHQIELREAWNSRSDRQPVAAYVLAPIGVSRTSGFRWVLLWDPAGVDLSPGKPPWVLRAELGDHMWLLEYVD